MNTVGAAPDGVDVTDVAVGGGAFRFSSSSDAAACQFFALRVRAPPQCSMPPPHSIHNRGRDPLTSPPTAHAHGSNPPGESTLRRHFRFRSGEEHWRRRRRRRPRVARKPRRLEQPSNAVRQIMNHEPGKWPRGHGDGEG